MRVPRVAYLADSFHEVNGVAHTSRNFVAYAERHGLPFLCVRAGGRAKAFEQVGEQRTQGAALAEAYANMDVLVFPSHTDTFGNVVLGALASGGAGSGDSRWRTEVHCAGPGDRVCNRG